MITSYLLFNKEAELQLHDTSIFSNKKTNIIKRVPSWRCYGSRTKACEQSSNRQDIQNWKYQKNIQQPKMLYSSLVQEQYNSEMAEGAAKNPQHHTPAH